MKALGHGFEILVLVAIQIAFLLQNAHRPVDAADSENITWGATDPTWSPDGRRLAFSLYGSIWQVAAEGGAAEQMSNSPGYHAHPAWSPKGGKIAFVSGSPPAGAKLNITGKLTLLDIETGVEREQLAPNRVAGTLAWSPDGATIACGLSIP